MNMSVVYGIVFCLILNLSIHFRVRFWNTVTTVNNSHYLFSTTKYSILDVAAQGLTGVDTDCFQHRYTDFGHTNLGLPKFNLKKN